MLKNLLNRNMFLFLLITAISIGGIIVYAMNHMTDSNKNEKSASLGNSTQATQKTNQADPQTIQNFDINNMPVEESAGQEDQQTVPVVRDSTPTSIPPTKSASAPVSAPITQVNELQVRDEKVGSGSQVKNGDRVEVNYLGTFLNGQKFDSSYDRNQTFKFGVGAGEVIKGWDLGLIGMKVGGKRILLIPSDLAYGAAGAPGAIPPNTPLKFEIELVSINP